MVNQFLRYGDFQTFKMTAIRHLWLPNIQSLMANRMPRVKMHHCATFCGNRSNSTVVKIWCYEFEILSTHRL